MRYKTLAVITLMLQCLLIAWSSYVFAGNPILYGFCIAANIAFGIINIHTIVS